MRVGRSGLHQLAGLGRRQHLLLSPRREGHIIWLCTCTRTYRKTHVYDDGPRRDLVSTRVAKREEEATLTKHDECQKFDKFVLVFELIYSKHGFTFRGLRHLRHVHSSSYSRNLRRIDIRAVSDFERYEAVSNASSSFKPGFVLLPMLSGRSFGFHTGVHYSQGLVLEFDKVSMPLVSVLVVDIRFREPFRASLTGSNCTLDNNPEACRQLNG